RLNDRATAATGICNPNKACGNSLEDFNIDNEEGDLILSHATCYAGTCSLATESANCEDLDGQTSADNPTPYCHLPDEFIPDPSLDYPYLGFYLASSNFHCENDGEANCVQTSINDPDHSQGMCEACMTRDLPHHHEGIWTDRSGQQACCGDDPAEGGYPYDTADFFPSSSGEYQSSRETICDDTFTGRGLPSEGIGIDNDCNGLANCEDPICGGNPGPTGNTCCTLKSHCTEALHEIARWVDCTGNECDCKEVEGDSADTPYRELDYRNIVTCVDETTGRDRFIRIRGLAPREYDFEVTYFTSLDGTGLDLTAITVTQVESYSEDVIIYFQHSSRVDGIVTVTAS
ncbi:hypothetical protein HQ545_03425, partial [Candidatus Woesearchaeota archaeon]|nr:hypothetical protein [Candidatus Woesearchaeota archaeon]